MVGPCRIVSHQVRERGTLIAVSTLLVGLSPQQYPEAGQKRFVARTGMTESSTRFSSSEGRSVRARRPPPRRGGRSVGSLTTFGRPPRVKPLLNSWPSEIHGETVARTFGGAWIFMICSTYTPPGFGVRIVSKPVILGCRPEWIGLAPVGRPGPVRGTTSSRVQHFNASFCSGSFDASTELDSAWYHLGTHASLDARRWRNVPPRAKKTLAKNKNTSGSTEMTNRIVVTIQYQRVKEGSVDGTASRLSKRRSATKMGRAGRKHGCAGRGASLRRPLRRSEERPTATARARLRFADARRRFRRRELNGGARWQ